MRSGLRIGRYNHVGAVVMLGVVRIQVSILRESFVLSDNALNASTPAYATQTIQLSGTGLTP